MEQHTYEIMNRVEESHWWFTGRRAILESFLDVIAVELRKSNSKDRDTNGESRSSDQALRILDVGCGTGANLEMLSKYGVAEGVDVSDEALGFCKAKGLKVRKGIAEELPFEHGSFDLVTALDVIEHLDDDVAGLKEMHRVLRRGGKALVFVPAFMWLWGVQDDVSNHRIRYTMDQIVQRLKGAGFEVDRATYANLVFFLPILAGRTIMKLTGIKPESENNINVSILNGFLGKLFATEQILLRHLDFPLGVSAIVVCHKE